MLEERPENVGKKVLELLQKLKPVKIDFLLDLAKKIKPEFDFFDRKRMHFDSWQLFPDAKLYPRDADKICHMKGMREAHGKKRRLGIARSFIPDEYVAYNVYFEDISIVQLLIETQEDEVTFCLLYGETCGKFHKGIAFDENLNELDRIDQQGVLKQIKAEDLK